MTHVACLLGGFIAGAATALLALVIVAAAAWERLK